MITSHSDLRSFLEIDDVRCDNYQVIHEVLSSDAIPVKCFEGGITIGDKQVAFPFDAGILDDVG